MMKEEMAWTPLISSIKAKCYYLPEFQEFEVEVQNGEKTASRLFTATFEPMWGMDVDDIKQANVVAEALNNELANGDGGTVL